MRIHANAPLSIEGRRRLVKLILSGVSIRRRRLVSRVVSSYAVPERIPREARTQISPNIGHIGAAEDAASRWDAAGNCHVIYDSGH